MKQVLVLLAMLATSAFLFTFCGGGVTEGSASASSSGGGSSDSAVEAKALPDKITMDGSGTDQIAAAKDSYNKGIQKVLSDFLGAATFNSNKAKLQPVFWDENPTTLKAKQWFTRQILGSSETGTGYTVSQELTLKVNKIRAALNRLDLQGGSGGGSGSGPAAVVPPPVNPREDDPTQEKQLDLTLPTELSDEELAAALKYVKMAVIFEVTPQFTEHAGRVVCNQISQALRDRGAQNVVDYDAFQSLNSESIDITGAIQGGTTPLQELARSVGIPVLIVVSGVVEVQDVAGGRMKKATGELTYKAFDETTASFIASDTGNTYVGAQTEDMAISGLCQSINRRVVHTLINKIAVAKSEAQNLRVEVIGLLDLQMQQDFTNAMKTNDSIEHISLVSQAEDMAVYDVFLKGKKDDFLEWVIAELRYQPGFELLNFVRNEGNRTIFSLE